MKTAMKQLLIILAFVTLNFKLETLNCFAQQYPLYSQYLFDGLTINPALAGNTNNIKGTLTYRKQFMGLPGAPLTQVFTVHGPLRIRSMGIGLKAVRDKLGVTSQTSISAVYAYHLGLAKGKLSFGLEGGLLSQSTDFPVLIKTDADDPLLQNKENVMIPDAAFGVYYHSGNFFTGASIAHLLRSRLNYTGSIAQLSNHYFLTGGYNFNAGENIQLKPSLFLKYVVGAPVQIDMNLNAMLKGKLTIGGGYRTDGEILFLFQYQFKDRIKFGYAFDYTVSKLGSYNNGSHEIMLSYNIKLKEPVKKPVEPIYEEIIAEVPPDKLYLIDQNGDTLMAVLINDDGFFVFESLPDQQSFLFFLDAEDKDLIDEVQIMLLNKEGEEEIITAVKTEEGYFRFESLPSHMMKLYLINQEGDTLRFATLNDEGYFVFEKLPLDRNYIFLLDAKDADIMDEILILIVDENGDEAIITADRDKENLFKYEYLPQLEAISSLDMEEAEELAIIEEEARLKAEEEQKRQEEKAQLEIEENEKRQEEEARLKAEEEQKRQEEEQQLKTEEEERHQEEEAQFKADENEKRQEEDILITEEPTMFPESNRVGIKGNITSNGLGLSSVTVKLFKGSDVIDEIKTSDNGEFSFDILLPEGDYSLYIAKDGFIDRLYDISTINKDNNEIITKNFELIKKRF